MLIFTEHVGYQLNQSAEDHRDFSPNSYGGTEGIFFEVAVQMASNH